MATQLQEHHNDLLEYMQNIKKFGGDEAMAEYQVRYHKRYVHQTIKEYIADLHLEKFATKEDLQNTKIELKSEIQQVRLEMKDMKHQLLMWQIGIGVTIMSANFAILKMMLP